MTALSPNSTAELSAALADHHARGAKLPPVDVRALNRVLVHTPEDMTVKVESGLPLAELQTRLATAGQWLPVDPPFADRVTIRELLDENLSGPRRCGHGTVREHLLGLTALLADGRLVRSGGNVVKNVAGYDLQKLFIGSRGTLGIVVEATFKVQPLPEAEEFIATRCESLAQAAALIETIQAAPLTPVAFDLYNSSHLALHTSHFTLVLAFAGAREDVAWQLAETRKLGFVTPADLTHDEQFWSQPGDVHKWSVLPSHLCETLGKLGETPFVARVANGAIFARGGPSPPELELPEALLRRVKDAFDPKRILPDLAL